MNKIVQLIITTILIAIANVYCCELHDILLHHSLSQSPQSMEFWRKYNEEVVEVVYDQYISALEKEIIWRKRLYEENPSERNKQVLAKFQKTRDLMKNDKQKGLGIVCRAGDTKKDVPEFDTIWGKPNYYGFAQSKLNHLKHAADEKFKQKYT